MFGHAQGWKAGVLKALLGTPEEGVVLIGYNSTAGEMEDIWPAKFSQISKVQVQQQSLF